MCLADVACGRMRGPWMLDSFWYPNSSHLSPRFCVEQGVKESGELKLRAIDDLSFSSLNAATQATEKLRCDTLDGLFEVLRRQTMHSQVRLHARYDAPCRRMRSLHVSRVWGVFGLAEHLYVLSAKTFAGARVCSSNRESHCSKLS